MKREVANEIVHTLNSPKITDCLKNYANDRIDSLRTEFETCKDIDRVRQIQGAMLELRNLIKLRDDALAVYNREMQRNG